MQKQSICNKIFRKFYIVATTCIYTVFTRSNYGMPLYLQLQGVVLMITTFPPQTTSVSDRRPTQLLCSHAQGHSVLSSAVKFLLPPTSVFFASLIFFVVLLLIFAQMTPRKVLMFSMLAPTSLSCARMPYHASILLCFLRDS